MSQHVSRGWRSAIRRSLPPPAYVIVAVLLVGLVEASWFGVRLFFGPNPALDLFLQIRDGLIAFLLIAYGMFRVLAFHPLFLREYSGWLERTPWRPGLPLPLGPVRLAWSDLIIAGGLALLLEDSRELLDPQDSRLSGLSGLLLFLQSHVLMVILAVWLTRPRVLAYVAAFLLPLGIRLSLWSPVAGMAALAAGIVVAHVGLSQSWTLFPWSETTEWASRIKTGWQSAQQMRTGQGFDDLSPDRVPPRDLGWPFGVCSPHVAPQMIGTLEKMLLAALFGFWIHALMAGAQADAVQIPPLFLMVHGAMMFAVGRLFVFVGNTASPINLAGRLLTLRWVIPRYDAAIVGPLSILFVPAAIGLSGHFWLGISLDILTPVVVTVALWTACLAGPSPENWKLTAPARLVPGRLNRSRFEELS